MPLDIPSIRAASPTPLPPANTPPPAALRLATLKQVSNQELASLQAQDNRPASAPPQHTLGNPNAHRGSLNDLRAGSDATGSLQRTGSLRERRGSSIESLGALRVTSPRTGSPASHASTVTASHPPIIQLDQATETLAGHIDKSPLQGPDSVNFLHYLRLMSHMEGKGLKTLIRELAPQTMSSNKAMNRVASTAMRSTWAVATYAYHDAAGQAARLVLHAKSGKPLASTVRGSAPGAAVGAYKASDDTRLTERLENMRFFPPQTSVAALIREATAASGASTLTPSPNLTASEDGQLWVDHADRTALTQFVHAMATLQTPPSAVESVVRPQHLDELNRSSDSEQKIMATLEKLILKGVLPRGGTLDLQVSQPPCAECSAIIDAMAATYGINGHVGFLTSGEDMKPGDVTLKDVAEIRKGLHKAWGRANGIPSTPSPPVDRFSPVSAPSPWRK